MRFTRSSPQDADRLSGLWFLGIVALFCGWVLVQPLFPTQDGPMHRYYVHVLGALLAHDSAYSLYQIRHPLPPYLTHYLALFLLSRWMPYDLAEKLFVCLILVTLAYGVRMAAKEAGPGGRWTSLLIAPLLLSWPLMMGMFNFVLAMGLAFFAMAFWQRMPRRGAAAFVAFLVCLILLTFTHPVPLLLLIVVCLLDLAVALLWRAPGVGSLRSVLRARAWQLAALACELLAAIFPALAVDTTQAHGGMDPFSLHMPFVRTALLLTGVSPYNSRSHSLLINAERLCLYSVLLVCLWMGGRAWLRSVRGRQVGLAGVLFLATIVLLVALPFVPDKVNGSYYFETRLVFVLWLGAIVSAAAFPVRQGRRWVAAAVICSACALAAAQWFVSPAARSLRRVEAAATPTGQQGLLLDGRLRVFVRDREQLAFDPYTWGGILPLVARKDIVLDVPWLDLKIIPVEKAPGGPEVVQDISIFPDPAAPGWEQGNISQADLHLLLARGVDFIVYGGTPEELAGGLLGQLTPAEAARFVCGAPVSHYILCTARGM